MATCYRHPKRETGVSCSNCGRPICPSCMTPTSVGMRCPECAGEKTKVRTISSVHSEPRVTMAIIAVCIVVYLASGSVGLGAGNGSTLGDRGYLRGYEISQLHEYWRLVTSGFLHSGLLHIGFNMYLLWMLGQQLEPIMGPRRFGAVYSTALLCGSFGSLVQTTLSPVVGASGAVFGLMGATAVELHRRGYSPFSGGLGGLIFLNLAISFFPGLNIAFGGHIGGLVGGVLAALAFDQADRRRLGWLGYVACGLLIVAAVAGSLAVAGNVHDYRIKL
jgi:membrane associated rhomboid family serine protease